MGNPYFTAILLFLLLLFYRNLEIFKKPIVQKVQSHRLIKLEYFSIQT
jgi:hypothetical protein